MTRTSRLAWLFAALCCLAVVTPATADSYLVYSQGGIPPASNLFTWCDSPPCDVSSPDVCGTPEGGASLRVNTNVWGGWGVFLSQGVDLSAFEGGDLRFFVRSNQDLKIEFQCQTGNPPATQTFTRFLSQETEWSGNNQWEEITVPICDFFPGGVCDTACLSNVVSPWLSTIENLPFFNSYNIDGVRWFKPSTGFTGASDIAINGRQLTIDGEPFAVNGAAYQPVSIGENWTGAWRDRPDRYNVDFPAMAAAGINTVRLYAPILSKAMLDAAWANGLYVIPQFGVDEIQLTCQAGRDSLTNQFVETMTEWSEHPAILAWIIGNEVNARVSNTDLCNDFYPQLDAMAAAAHAAEGSIFHPIGTANADISGGFSDICQAGCSDDTTLPNIDYWAAQVYRGCAMDTVFSDYASKSDCSRPLLITEFGVDAYDSVLDIENQNAQNVCFQSLLQDAEENLAVRNPAGVSAGQVIFEWLDEWWKVDCDGSDWNAQDTCVSFENFAFPDPGINEEWWGLVRQSAGDPDARIDREALETVTNAWALGAVCDLDVVNYDSTTGETDIAFAAGSGSASHSLYYGPLSAVSSYGYTDEIGGLGATGAASVTLPNTPESLFWVVVANNGPEGCYGPDSDGAERPCFGAGCETGQSPARTCACP